MSEAKRKISVVGAGMVGATLGQRIFESAIADVVLIDVLKNIAKGKAMDLLDGASITGTEKSIIGTDDYRELTGSDIVVIAAGFARRPGMSREDLIAKNASIVEDVSVNVRTYAKDAIVIVVTNPLDTMTYAAYRTTSFGSKRVFGMAGVLDSSRFIALAADELNAPRSSIKTYILGSHGDTMVPLITKTFVSGRPITELMPADRLENILSRTRDRGAEIVSLLGSGSAYYSPSAAALKMIRAIFTDSGEVMVASAYLKGEYGLNDICIGVPCKIGKDGIDMIIEIEMSAGEKEALARSAQAIKKSIQLLR